MCGIVAYAGHRQAHPVILKGLKRLEYRGYDSAGIALLNGSLQVYKKKGKVEELEKHLAEAATPANLKSHIGIGHTRWATHGEPNDVNAHPHYSQDGKLAIIHNGIIENYDALKKELILNGHTFKSETDTEVLIHFIEYIRQQDDYSLEEAVRIALKRVIGAYAIVIISADEPDMLIAAAREVRWCWAWAKMSSFWPLMPHRSSNTPMKWWYLNDDEVCVIRNHTFVIKDLNDVPTNPHIQTLDIELEAIEKGGFDSFMLKEIYEQPKSISDCMRGRLNADTHTIMLGGLQEYTEHLVQANRIIIMPVALPGMPGW